MDIESENSHKILNEYISNYDQDNEGKIIS